MANIQKSSNKIIFAKIGFTLLEVVLSIAIIAVLGVGITGAIISFQTQSDLDASVMILVDSLRRAEILAKTSQIDSTWGVSAATGTITIFKGPSFAARDTAFDEASEINSDISIIGITEYVFTRFAATTTNIGTTTLMHIALGRSRNVAVSEKGKIDY